MTGRPESGIGEAGRERLGLLSNYIGLARQGPELNGNWRSRACRSCKRELQKRGRRGRGAIGSLFRLRPAVLGSQPRCLCWRCAPLALEPRVHDQPYNQLGRRAQRYTEAVTRTFPVYRTCVRSPSGHATPPRAMYHPRRTAARGLYSADEIDQDYGLSRTAALRKALDSYLFRVEAPITFFLSDFFFVFCFSL